MPSVYVCTIPVPLLLCRLRADESIPNRSGIVLASGTLHLIASNRATAAHYSEDQMSLKKGNVLFISVVSGAIYIHTALLPLLCELAV